MKTKLGQNKREYRNLSTQVNTLGASCRAGNYRKALGTRSAPVTPWKWTREKYLRSLACRWFEPCYLS